MRETAIGPVSADLSNTSKQIVLTHVSVLLESISYYLSLVKYQLKSQVRRKA